MSALADRDQAVRDIKAAEKARQAKYSRAHRMVADRLPDLTDGRGGPCPWAVWSLLDAWNARGEGNATESQIRAGRTERLQAHKARWGYDPTTEGTAA